MFIFLDEKIWQNKWINISSLKTNIEFYANDSYLANKKINRLIKAGMPEHASEILRELLKEQQKKNQLKISNIN